MKRDRIATSAVALLLGCCLGISGVLCLTTGFRLESFCDVPTVVVTALLLGLLGAVAFSFSKGGYGVLAILALTGGYLWQDGACAAQLEKLLYNISFYYNNAYGWGIVNWSVAAADTVSLPLGLWAGLTTLLTARSLCRRKGVLLPLLFASVPLISTVVVTDTPPDAAPLLCFLLASTLLVLTNTVRRRSSHRDANRLTAYLALPLALALGLLFHFVPQEGYRGAEYVEALQSTLLSTAQRLLNGELNLNLPGSSDTVDLRQVGPQTKLSFRVMDVTADRGGTLYLRQKDYALYSATSWGSDALRTDDTLIPDASYLEEAGSVTIQTVGTWDEVLLPYYPSEPFTAVGGALANSDRARTYTHQRMALRSDWQDMALRTESEGDSFPILSGYFVDPNVLAYQYAEPYLLLPYTTQKWAVSLANEIGEPGMTTPEKAEAIAAYVRGSAAYSLNTPAPPEDVTDFVRWFLEDCDTGYCVHFASATVVLLRAAKIPARYVEGYMFDAKAGQKTAVTAGDAHAWAEYYVKNVGWIPLESTPSITTGASPAIPEATTPTAPRESTQPTQSTAPSAVTTAPTESGNIGLPIPGAETKADLTPLWTALKALTLAAGLLILLWGQWYLRRRYRNRKDPDPNRQALIYWQEAARMAQYLRDVPPEELERIAQKAKFSQHAITADELEPFTTWISLTRARLQAEPWYRRLWYRLILALY